ncbi:50S ribosomal protein L24 [Candidatus Uhrbacteria bacterium RIFCSPHIGHO2_12_FULL_57_11]|uniref:Large ribosomal subunit protein uL24 n=2 Tax=Candidatus Uhriibacteriota TaxID=1752732 RepID=A0A1F7UJU2_9BACT|nr:MAG: 50S ribosomal protein L24 [Candidatus Uhrbacteria bacterium RIFCSPHIGHO2_02_FULL_57_19]OGL78540.1 MAG: 50S ribosomal protein L24 [Candidatus Uhrbacteria bacterium RIFCSPHIGHO2_12_FULL_57_11]
MNSLKIRTGDKVKVIAGKEKGKTGKVIQVFPSASRAVVEGVNVITRHVRGRRGGEKGQKLSFPGPLHVSNLMLVCGKCGKTTRLAMKILEDGKRIRVCKHCGEGIV